MPTTLGIKLDEQTQRRLKALGRLKDRSPHWLMKEAVARYLDVEEYVERERREDRARYERYVDTGEHFEHDQMMRWLDDLAVAAGRRVAAERPKRKARKR